MYPRRYCCHCGQLLSDTDEDDDQVELISRMKEKPRGYIELIYAYEKDMGDVTKGKSQFIIYDSEKKKWAKKIGKTQSRSQVLYEGLASFFDGLRNKAQIDLYTSDKIVVNQINRKAGLPSNRELSPLCEAIRYFLNKVKGVSLNYIPEAELKANIRKYKSGAISKHIADY